MLQGTVAFAESPPGPARARPRRPGFAWGSRRALPRPVAGVSDEQIVALVAAAEGLRRCQRQCDAGDSPSAAADGRLLSLAWAVRNGPRVPADLAAHALTPTSAAAAQP